MDEKDAGELEPRSAGSVAPPSEDPIRLAFDAGDLGAVATQTLERYGGEVLGFLVARLPSAADGHEVFSMFCEDLWAGLPGFRWQATMRSYCYTLARNAANRYAVAPANRRERRAALSDAAAEVAQIADRVRSRTAPHLRTEVKSRMRLLREALPEVDQTLLILRVDRGLSFREIAQVLADGDGAREPGALEPAALDQHSARWRKRFQLVKERLKERAREEGLLDE